MEQRLVIHTKDNKFLIAKLNTNSNLVKILLHEPIVELSIEQLEELVAEAKACKATNADSIQECFLDE